MVKCSILQMFQGFVNVFDIKQNSFTYWAIWNVEYFWWKCSPFQNMHKIRKLFESEDYPWTTVLRMQASLMMRLKTTLDLSVLMS